MEISFKKRKLGKDFNSEKLLKKAYNEPMAKAIMKRMRVLLTAKNLGMVPAKKPERRHQLDGDRKGQFAVDLVHPHRLVFEPNHTPVPLKEKPADSPKGKPKAGKEIDLARVTAITIIEVVDYH